MSNEQQSITAAQAEEQKDTRGKTKRNTSSNDVLDFVNLFCECFKPEFGICDLTGKPVITYVMREIQYSRFIESKDFEHIIIKCMIESGYQKDMVLTASERVVKILVSEAICSEKKFKIDRRYGLRNGTVYINLHNSKGEIVAISKDETKILRCTPMNFMTSPKDLPLPDPMACSPAEFLKLWNSFQNFQNKDSSYLALACLVKFALPESGANPILILEGIQGSGKTTLSKAYKKLIDPTHPSVFSQPKNEKDFLVMANTTYLMVIDNSSGISAELADVLCRASTGGGISLRVLYETDEERVYYMHKSMIINGIEELSDRADLIERSFILHLKSLSQDSRISESQFWEKFNSMYPLLTGGFHNIISQVLKYLPDIQNENLVRMTEFHRVGLALDKVFGLPEGHFTAILHEHQNQKVHSLFDNDLLCQLIKDSLNKGDDLVGSSSQIMKKVYKNKADKVPYHILPRDPRRFKAKLQRLKPILEANGIVWGELDRTSDCRGIYIQLQDDTAVNSL